MEYTIGLNCWFTVSFDQATVHRSGKTQVLRLTMQQAARTKINSFWPESGRGISYFENKDDDMVGG